VENGVPNLHLANALPVSVEGKPRISGKSMFFVSDQEGGFQFSLTPGSCRIVGRQTEALSKDQVFNADFTVSLDEPIRKLIQNTLELRYGKKVGGPSFFDFGPFKRLPDVLLYDNSVSRLHALFFYDEEGMGVLDLVSQEGTFVNGKEVEMSDVAVGDEVILGRMKFGVKFK